MAVASAKKFLRTMAQPFSGKDQDGVSTWSIEDLERHKEKLDEEKIRELRNEEHVLRREGGNGVAPEEEFGEDMDAEMMDLMDGQV